MAEPLPYCAEYAKSSRAGCQGCKMTISKDSLRLATVIQSPFFDGLMTRWYHAACFFKKQRPKTAADIAQFDNLRWEDQQDIKKKIEENAGLAPTPQKGKKRSAKTTGATSDFRVEYAKSGKSTCRGCEEKIVKDEVRISKKDYESDDARRFGGLDKWYHVECFAKLRASLQYFGSGADLSGFKALKEEDRKELKTALPKMKEEDVPPVKKVKQEAEDAEEEKEMKKQNDEMFSIRDQLSTLKKNELVLLLESNKQEIPEGVAAMLDRLADAIYFGALKPCPKCKGQLVYTSGLGYKCTGNASEWAKCEHVTQDPKRQKFVVPTDLKDAQPCLSAKLKVRRRLIKVVAPSTSALVKKEDTVDAGPLVTGKPKPLKNMHFVILGRTEKNKDDLKKEIQLLGGTVSTKINENTVAVISTQKELDKMGKRMEEAKEHDVHVITEDFIEEAKEYTDAPIMLIKKKTISSWGGDLASKVSNIAAKSAASKSKSKYERKSGQVKMQVKGGGTVDPESGLEDCAHVYQSGREKYTATLGLTDIQTRRNSYYKLQILKHDKKNIYWLFRSWGRIGTTINGNKLESMSLESCIEMFENLYAEKSGNEWRNRDNFVKVPGRLYPVDIDHGDDEDTAKLMASNGIESKLKKPVQDLMRLIFDMESMKKVMLEFEIDMDKLPLGKLSKKQIQKAFTVLSELQELIKTANVERVKLIDASNRFYTLIPHNFGVDGPEVLDTQEMIQNKCEMLDALMEMEIAYNLLHLKTTDKDRNLLDVHYEQLNAEIDVLERDSETFKIIEQYVKNTHAATHSQYELEIEDVFVVKRQGEEQRYKPFKKLPNRKLLWHGSRITNFAGILSQGLRIAPPEAPVTGYMFGKGIYFADMVSKSANYCCTNSSSPTGLLLLCEVALGNVYERYQADYIEKLPKGKHSTLGRGQTQPDPEKTYKLEDGVEVPLGSPVPVKQNKKSSLLYNEYIVYDVAQVQVKYLLKMNFKFAY